MSAFREELIYAAISKAYNLTDDDDFNKQYEFQKQTVVADESLTNDEKIEATRRLDKVYDQYKVLYNEGTKRICEICNQECLATTYCEICIRNCLKVNFSNWTSGNDNIDNLIQACQMKALMPS